MAEPVRRICMVVIGEMLKLVPKEKTEFIKDLEWNLEDASYKPPEQNDQWDRTMHTLMKHIPKPKEEWEYQILSIFTTKSIEELKKIKY